MIDTHDLSGRVAIVTGAAGGIGTAIVADLVRHGARVAAWDLPGRTTDVDGALAVGVDITSATSVRDAFAATVDALGDVSIAVNNAGIDVIAPFLDTTEDDWNRIVAVNLHGVFNVCRTVLPSMIERRGDDPESAATIVNIASDAGRVGSSGEAVYSATKGGVIAFTKTLAREHARQGITVNCVCPGPTDTPLLDQVADANQRLYDGLARAVPLGRIGQPSDIAHVVAFLASPAAGYMTGQTLSVSGGLTMS
jgi:2-hydroxycyclohexanecarboxyl-CoA dehydrogenase